MVSEPNMYKILLFKLPTLCMCLICKLIKNKNFESFCQRLPADRLGTPNGPPSSSGQPAIRLDFKNGPPSSCVFANGPTSQLGGLPDSWTEKKINFLISLRFWIHANLGTVKMIESLVSR